MFSKGDQERFSTSLGLKAAPITFGILTVVPVVFLVISMFDTSWLLVSKIVVLVLLLAISLYSGTPAGRKAAPIVR